MKQKNYTTKQTAEALGVIEQRVRGMLKQDQSPNKRKTHFPHAKKCDCGQAWLIPEQDIKAHLYKKD